MPIDSSIISRLQPTQIQQRDPLEAYGKSLALKNMMGQGDMQALQMRQAQQGIEDENAVRDAYRQAGGDSKALRALLQERGAHRQLQALDKAELEAEARRAGIVKDKAAAGKSQHDIDMGKLERGAAILNEAKDQQSFAAALRVGQLTGTFAPEFVAQMMEQGYSPQLVQSLQAAGLTRAKQLEDQRAREQHGLKAANEPFLPGPNGPVPQVPVQQFQFDKARKGATNVQVKTDVKTGESLAGQIGPMMKESTATADGAVRQVDAAQRIVKAIDSGNIITGPLANQRVTMSQVGQMLGVGGKDEAEKLANTRQAVRGLAELTLQGRQQMRGQGAITESEGKLAEKAMSGEISELTAAEIRQLARASERAARFNYAEHNRKLKVMQDNPDLTKMAPFYQGPAMPAEVIDPAAQPKANGVLSPNQDGSFTYGRLGGR